MKKMLYFLAVFSSIFFVLYATCYQKPQPPLNLGNVTENSTDGSPYLTRVQEFNKKVSAVQSIHYPKIETSTNGIGLIATIRYKKQHSFRMFVSSMFGSESDIGSNEEVFWFWSKRMTPSALFFSSHENLASTRLKPSFNPNWLQQILGVNEISEKSDLFLRMDGKLVCIEEQNGMKKVLVFDLEKDAPCAHYLFDLNQKPLASVEVKEYHQVNGLNLPKNVEVYWAIEKIRMKWEMDRPILNPNFSDGTFTMPSITPKIDLKDYF